MKSHTVGAVIAIEGFVSIAVEILCMRQLSVFMGNSVLVTSIIIGVFLLALAYGYKRGAQYTENLNIILSRNLIVSGAILGIGLSYCFVFLFFNIIEKTISTNSFVALVAYLSLIIAPLIYHLGQTVPITMNLYNQHQTPGAIGGKVLHLSAIGSFLGAILTTIVFMHFLGVQATVILNCALLILAALLINTKKLHLIKSSLIIAAVIPFVYFFNHQESKMNLLASNEYSNYMLFKDHLIDENRFGTVFAINHSASSFAENGTQKGFSYIEKIKDILFSQLKIHDKNILVLGAGGFSLSAADTYNNKFLYVDIDPNLEKVVSKYKIASINGEFIASDARLFLRKNNFKFDVIVSDVYSHKTTIPQHLITKEYFNLVALNIENKGVAIFNLIIHPFLQDAYSAKIDNTIRSAFNFCSATVLDYSSDSSNVVYLCSNAKPSSVHNIYTDNNSQAALDSILG